MSAAKRARWGLRRTFQQEQVIHTLTAWDNIRLAAEHTGGGPRRGRAAVDFVGLEGLDRPGSELTMLERRLVETREDRVRPARSSCCSTSREPASTPRETERLIGLIRRFLSEFGALVILVDHDMDLVSTVCGTTAVLDFGQLIAFGPTADVLASTEVRRAYLGTSDVEVARMTEALIVEGLVIERGGREVVHGVDLTAQPGTITALLGPNGAGKSSLVLALGRGHEAPAGSVTIGDEELVGKKPTAIRAAGLATVPEGHRVLKDMTVDDNLRVASFLVPRAERAAAVDRVHALFEELAAARRSSRRVPLRRPTADARDRPGARRRAAVPRDRRDVARSRPDRRAATGAGATSDRGRRRRRDPDRAVHPARARPGDATPTRWRRAASWCTRRRPSSQKAPERLEQAYRLA